MALRVLVLHPNVTRDPSKELVQRVGKLGTLCSILELMYIPLCTSTLVFSPFRIRSHVHSYLFRPRIQQPYVPDKFSLERFVDISSERGVAQSRSSEVVATVKLFYIHTRSGSTFTETTPYPRRTKLLFQSLKWRRRLLQDTHKHTHSYRHMWYVSMGVRYCRIE